MYLAHHASEHVHPQSLQERSLYSQRKKKFNLAE